MDPWQQTFQIPHQGLWKDPVVPSEPRRHLLTPKWKCYIKPEKRKSPSDSSLVVTVMENYRKEGRSTLMTAQERGFRKPPMSEHSDGGDDFFMGESDGHKKRKAVAILQFWNKVLPKSVPWRRHTWNCSGYKKWQKQVKYRRKEVWISVFPFLIYI